MTATDRPPVGIGRVHYQILAAVGLVLVFFAQLDQGAASFLSGVLVVFVGGVGLAAQVRAAPIFMLLVLGVGQAANRLVLLQTFAFDEHRPLLHPRDLTLAMGLLAYLAGHYRLLSLAVAIVPPEPRWRLRLPTLPRGRRRQEEIPESLPRDSRSLTPAEIARFAVVLPIGALAGQLLWWLVQQRWTPYVLPVRLHRLIALIWIVVLGAVVAAAVFTHWRRRHMDRGAARLLLQDMLWRETRREQRRIFRWLAWRRLRKGPHEARDPATPGRSKGQSSTTNYAGRSASLRR
ncbi:MAG: hypothetical protein NZO58_07400 [Gemmataceae bacterium]|nr:hypothetical protein [Gemmataceae bacterium]